MSGLSVECSNSRPLVEGRGAGKQDGGARYLVYAQQQCSISTAVVKSVACDAASAPANRSAAAVRFVRAPTAGWSRSLPLTNGHLCLYRGGDGRAGGGGARGQGG